MKISSFIFMLLIVGVVFFIFAQMVNEANTSYPGSDLNSSSWNNSYDFAISMNNTISPLKKDIDTIQSDASWFSKVIAGISAIPMVVINFILAISKSLGFGTTLITNLLSVFSLPAYIILVATIMMIVWVVIKLVEMLQRWYL